MLVRTIIAAVVLTLSVASSVVAEPKKLTPTDAKAIDRAADALCEPLETEVALVQAIAEERKNPSGVIDLRKLHELGDTLAQMRAAIKQAKIDEKAGLAIFRKWAGHAMDLGFCEARDRAKEKADQ